MESKRDRKKIFIITQHFPYGNGEKTFIEPELLKMTNDGRFDVTIISNAVERDKLISKVNNNIQVITVWNKPILKRPVQCLKYLLSYFCSGYGRHEICEIVKSNGRRFGKCLDSVIYYIQACIFYGELKRKNIILDDSIIYTYWFYTQTLAIALHKNELKNIRLISRIHGYDLYKERNRNGRQPFRTLMDKETDCLFFIADAGLKYYLKDIERKNEFKYKLCRLGTFCNKDYSEIARLQKKSEVFLIVSCSNVIPLKRVNCIVEALAKISDFDMKWIHFGDGSELKETKELAFKLLKDKRNIKYCFKGQSDNKDICSFYENYRVDCFLTVSASEGCPVSIQEALSYGIPVVASAVGEIPIMVNENGILLNEYPTPGETAEAILKMYHMSEEEKSNMRRKSRILWENYFNGENNYRLFLDELNRLQEE